MLDPNCIRHNGEISWPSRRRWSIVDLAASRTGWSRCVRRNPNTVINMVVRDRIFAREETLARFQQNKAQSSLDLPKGFLFVKVSEYWILHCFLVSSVEVLTAVHWKQVFRSWMAFGSWAEGETILLWAGPCRKDTCILSHLLSSQSVDETPC